MVGIEDVRCAAERLQGVAYRTPLLASRRLHERTGVCALLKAECLQHTGSFKFRGAYNKIASIPPKARRRGVVAFSSGNHAQAVALAASLLDSRATIVMPSDAPAIKLAGTRHYGAEVVTYDRYSGDRERIGLQLAEAMRFGFDHLKLVLEPSGAAALAALLSDKLEFHQDARVGVILSGGNVDLARFFELLRPTGERPSGERSR